MKRYIAGLNGLRAIAVALVVINHKFPIGDKLKPGGSGVHLFFVLSGFLIISILAERRGAIEGGRTSFGIELVHFYQNRAYRIWPIYYLSIFVAIGCGYIGLGPRIFPSLIVSTLTFTSNFFTAFWWQGYPPAIGALWSVAVEEQFYLWAAPAFLLCGMRWHGLVCWAVIIVAIVYSAAFLISGYYPRAVYVGPFSNFGLMALGGLAATRVDYRKWMSVAAPWALIAYLACIPFAQLLPATGMERMALGWGATLLVPLILMGVAGDENGDLTRFLESRWIKYIGVISYGIYIYHGLIDLRYLAPSLHLNPNIAGLIESCMTVAIADLSWRCIEKPLLRLRDNRRRRVAEQKVGDLEVSALGNGVEGRLI